jgi:hypothetical protein
VDSDGNVLMGKKNKKFLVLMDLEEFSRYHSYCEMEGHKKSTLAALLIRKHLDQKKFQNITPSKGRYLPKRKRR